MELLTLPSTLIRLPSVDNAGGAISTPAVHVPTQPLDIPIDKGEREKKVWRFKVAFFALSTVASASSLDATSLSMTLPVSTIPMFNRYPYSPAEIDNSTRAQWHNFLVFLAGITFLLTSVLFQPIRTALSSIFGRKPVI
jgi:hypothetical protein